MSVVNTVTALDDLDFFEYVKQLKDLLRSSLLKYHTQSGEGSTNMALRGKWAQFCCGWSIHTCLRKLESTCWLYFLPRSF